jgi:hypothetical protein
LWRAAASAERWQVRPRVTELLLRHPVCKKYQQRTFGIILEFIDTDSKIDGGTIHCCCYRTGEVSRLAAAKGSWLAPVEWSGIPSVV